MPVRENTNVIIAGTGENWSWTVVQGDAQYDGDAESYLKACAAVALLLKGQLN